MKKLLLSLPILAAAYQAHGQGYVIFASVTQDLSVEKRIADAITSQYLDSVFVAQLFAGVQGALENALVALDVPVYFLDSPPESIGEFLGNEIMIPGVGVGSTATLQVRVWPAAYATWADAYTAALGNASVHVGSSSLFDVVTAAQFSGTEIAPLMPVFMVTSIPEPSVIGLGLLGVGLTFLRRRAIPD